DDRSGAQLQAVRAAGEFDRVGTGAAVVGQPAFDRATVDNGEIRADDANAASAGITVGPGLAVTPGPTGATRDLAIVDKRKAGAEGAGPTIAAPPANDSIGVATIAARTAGDGPAVGDAAARCQGDAGAAITAIAGVAQSVITAAGVATSTTRDHAGC